MPVTITTRAGKGSALTATENDANLTVLQGGVFSVTALKTTAYTAGNLEIVRTDTTSAGWTLTLPGSPTDGMRVIAQDDATAGSWGTNVLTVSPNGSRINNSTSNVTLAGRWGRVEFFYVSAAAGWFSRWATNTRPLLAANNLSEISGTVAQAAAKANLGISEAPGAEVTSWGGTYSAGTSLFASAHGQSPQTNQTVTALTEYWAPFWWPWSFTPSLIGLDVQTAVAAAQVKCGIYAMNADYSIGTRLAVSATIDGSTVAIATKAIAPAWGGPGLYWAAYHSDQAVAMRGFAAAGVMPLIPYKSSSSGAVYLSRASITFAAALGTTPPALSALSPSAGQSLVAVLLGVP